MDPSLAISLASAFLALVIAYVTYHAFRYTSRSYLLNFSAGFLLLGLSYILLVPLALGVKMPALLADGDDIVNYPLFAFMQTFGYILIALTYYQSGRVKQILGSLIGILAFLLVLVVIPGIKLPESGDILLYFVNTALLGYVLYHLLKVIPAREIVIFGFLLLALHEFTALVWSVEEAIFGYPDEGSFFLAEVLRLFALCLLFYCFLETRRVENEQYIGSVQSA